MGRKYSFSSTLIRGKNQLEEVKACGKMNMERLRLKASHELNPHDENQQIDRKKIQSNAAEWKQWRVCVCESENRAPTVCSIFYVKVSLAAADDSTETSSWFLSPVKEFSPCRVPSLARS